MTNDEVLALAMAREMVEPIRQAMGQCNASLERCVDALDRNNQLLLEAFRRLEVLELERLQQQPSKMNDR